ncbi:MAG: sigma-70 family RNA polymerase sigma factor [Gammaproteobacteria bacterium]
MDQAELLRRCATGDKVAFQELYRATAPQLFAVLLRILNRRDLAEEALQDTFVRIWMNAGTYRPGRGQPLTWMISIARYRAVDLYRRSRAEGLVADSEDELAAAESTEPGPVALTELAHDSRALHHCLDQLSADQQRSIRLAYMTGYTHEQIAVVTKAPLGTVKSWVRRGLLALKSCLDRPTMGA